MKITALGDSALTVHVRAEFESDAESCLREVSALLHFLESARLPGVRELAPAFTSVSVFYNPAQVAAGGAPVDDIFGWLEKKITALCGTRADEFGVVGSDAAVGEKPIEIPVCYESEFAPDLSLVAKNAGLTEAEVVRQHSSALYRVACLGFMPGFPYLVGLPPSLATPRLSRPRTLVAAGSVGIGGGQTGIYPQDSPGGWNVIGRTPRRLFDPNRAVPALLARGDAVRFRSISRSEFDAMTH